MAESLATACLKSLKEGKVAGQGLSHSRSLGVSSNQCTCSLSPWYRLLQLLPAYTGGGWQGRGQPRACGKVGASHICTRASVCVHAYTLIHSQKVSSNKLIKTNLPSDNP